LDFYPIDAHGLNIHKFSQSRKWREELPSDMRVQMVSVNGKHFYIYEPTQLFDGMMVIPIFFYFADGELYSKCIRPQLGGEVKHDNAVLVVPHWLPYSSAHLMTVKCSEFHLIYSEISRHGIPVTQVYNSTIWGRC
jgi:hypothetical protein